MEDKAAAALNDPDDRGQRCRARRRALRRRLGPARPARGRDDDALLARRAVRGARRRRTPRRALRPARQRRLDHRRSRGSGVHAARPRGRRRGACPRARRPAGAPGGHRRRRDGRPGRRARPPGRVLGAHPRRDAARRPGPGRQGPARPRRGDHEAAVLARRRPTGRTARPWRSSPPPARRSSATTPPPRARPPGASGTGRRAPSPPSRWPTRWASCSPSSTANRAGASACPSSRSRCSSCTVAGTRSFRVGNGEALAREIPGARLLVLEEAATRIPDGAAGEVAAAMLALRVAA